ncbi:MAG: ATPase [Candidatus Electrothrix sp. AR3]|nr:ATPase [Candidatus Electrothrix sp. AR3]
MLLADFGSSYCKLLDSQLDAEPKIISNQNISLDFKVDLATGHNAKRRSKLSINELTALARGGRGLIEEANFTLLDCGSRDTKFIRYEATEVADMGWNAECGASMGFTIELLQKYYSIDYATTPVPENGFSVTCGVLGMSHIFDAVIAGSSETEAVAKFICGIARNAYRFSGSPARIYLSGGLCDNPLFISCFPCEVIPLGRFVLLEGLKEYLATPQPTEQRL